MTNEEKLIQEHDNSKTYIPLKTLYGSKYLLSLINLILICIIIILCIVSIVLFSLPPAKEISTTLKVTGNQYDNTVFSGDNPIDAIFSKGEKQANVDYSIIPAKNIFSPDRKEWVTKVVIPKPSERPIKPPEKKPLPRKTTKFILHGIVITGNIKKALINNPMPGLNKKRTIYVEEGDEIEGYRVTSIESNLIRLDWHGEEIIVELYSGLGDIDQSETLETPRPDRGNIRYREDKNLKAPGLKMKMEKAPGIEMEMQKTPGIEMEPDYRTESSREDSNPFADIK
jgi:hypothetical protein